jgi:DNA polymerase-3 subunit epsilon
MNARTRFVIAVAILGLLMTGPFLLTALIILADSQGAQRESIVALLRPHLPLGGLLTTLGFALGFALLRALFRHYVRGLHTMSEQLRLMLRANRDFRIPVQGPPEVAQLARAANDLAQQRNDLLSDVEARVVEATAIVEEEKNRLAALMSELTLGVIMCTLDGRILLYNPRARQQFETPVDASSSNPLDAGAQTPDALVGLGRSVFSILERNQITHALDEVRRRLSAQSAHPCAHFVTATRGGQLLRVHMAPVLRPEQGAMDMSGFVLTIDNITRSLERDATRDQLLQSLTDGTRASLGSIRAAAETLHEDGRMPQDMRERFVEIIRDEATRMSERLDDVTHRFADALKTRWPLEDVLGIDIVAAARTRIESRLALPTKTEALDDALWIRADSFTLIQAITFLASRLHEHYDIRELRFRLASEAQMAFLDLIWSGQPVSSETLYTWELEALSVGEDKSPLSLRDVIDRHGGEIWYQREKAVHRAFFRLVLPQAQAPEQERPVSGGTGAVEPKPGAASRPEYYDFNLFRAPDARVDLDRRVDALSYTVFDTETTGLEPARGDEIIQIGAVRIVNGRLLAHEVFDQLVDPRCPLKPEGIPIHGITEDMLQGQPQIGAVLPRFHAFCADTVLVAHNAAFDMRFLQLKEEATGVRFTQPVLDTLLLSAVIHPAQESHRLEAIAERFGINIIGRHTGLGDAFVTAEVFMKMLPLLGDMGLYTLRDVLAAAEKTYYARVKY